MSRMRRFVLAIFATILSGASQAADLGILVEEFPARFQASAAAAGSDILPSQPRCSLDSPGSCTLDYGSVLLMVEAGNATNPMAERFTLRSNVMTPLYQIFEAMEFSTTALRPDLRALDARRFAFRIFENLVIGSGMTLTDVIDNYEVVTEEDMGDVLIVIQSTDF